MDELVGALRRHGVSLTIAVYPWPEQIRAGDVDSRQARFWKRWAAAHGADFIDYFPQFTGAPAPALIRRYFIPGDFHWNAEGHRLIARGYLDHRKRPR
jgi:hypothetical protein